MDAGILTLSGVHLPDFRDPLGVWSLESSDAAVFAAHEVDEARLTWQVCLPDSSREAHRVLQSALRVVKEKRVALRALESAFPRMVPTVHWSPGDRTFDDTLWEGVVLARATATAPSIPQVQGPAIGDLVEQGQRLLGRLQRLLTYFAWIETRRSGTLVGITQVDWRGDFKTTWGPDVSEESMALHLKAVRLALASRLALLQMVVVVMGGALVLATRASVPGGQILLIPVVYDYVRDILSAWNRIQDAVEAGA